ncbi:MAG: hypothetical protein OXI53_12625 [Nitrospira sp.]|nr:hypothetical protein [Nitrospira sp.]
MWLFRCASDDDLEYFKKEDDLKKKFGDRIKDIEKLSGDDEKILSTIKRSAWSAMCSYTHTGMSQLDRYNSSQAIEANLQEDEVIEALNFANVFGLLSALWMVPISGNDGLVNVLREKIDEYNEYSEQIFLSSNPDSSSTIDCLRLPGSVRQRVHLESRANSAIHCSHEHAQAPTLQPSNDIKAIHRR